MKHIFSMLVAVAALFMVACGGPSTPSEAAAKVYDQLIAGDYEAVAESFYFGKATPEEEAQGQEMILSMLNEKAAPQFEKKGGLKSYEILSEKIAEDAQSAKVEIKAVYGDGSEKKDKIDMVLDGDGNWRPSMKK